MKVDSISEIWILSSTARQILHVQFMVQLLLIGINSTMARIPKPLRVFPHHIMPDLRIGFIRRLFVRISAKFGQLRSQKTEQRLLRAFENDQTGNISYNQLTRKDIGPTCDVAKCSEIRSKRGLNIQALKTRWCVLDINHFQTLEAPTIHHYGLKVLLTSSCLKPSSLTQKGTIVESQAEFRMQLPGGNEA